MNYTVIGAARSGFAAALLAKELGNNVFLSESQSIDNFREASKRLSDAGIDFEFGKNSDKALKNADIIITSPGVPPNAWIIQESEKRNIPIISELEYAWQQCKDNPVIAITGTNGKTTTTTLTAFILNQAGKKAVAVGNIGTPLSSIVKELEPDTIIVLEVSSYQLDRIDKFQPKVAVILNFSPDHLSYHGTMENYISTKFNICSNQKANDILILNADDKEISAVANNSKGNTVHFSMSEIDWGIYRKKDRMCINFPNKHKEEEIMLFEEIRLPGIHNAYNSMAAALAARAFEIRNEDIRDSLMMFEGVEHRLEFVRNLNDVDFINDSKATNINATWYALSSFKKPLIWIAGGRADSNDYSGLDNLVKENVKCIISIGEESANIFNHYSTMVRCIREDSMEDAVKTADLNSKAGDIVLFSPACKSFDMFVNYEHRGEVFKEIVFEL